jgi:hypothetical protein
MKVSVFCLNFVFFVNLLWWNRCLFLSFLTISHCFSSLALIFCLFLVVFLFFLLSPNVSPSVKGHTLFQKIKRRFLLLSYGLYYGFSNPQIFEMEMFSFQLYLQSPFTFYSILSRCHSFFKSYLFLQFVDSCKELHSLFPHPPPSSSSTTATSASQIEWTNRQQLINEMKEPAELEWHLSKEYLSFTMEIKILNSLYQYHLYHLIQKEFSEKTFQKHYL